jgi:hypothetical protein
MKRRGRIAVGLGVVASLALAAAAGRADSFLPGDLNDDRSVDVVDATVLRRSLAGLGPGISQTCQSPVCGDALVNGLEACDGTNLSGATCQSLGLGGGTLACSASCTFDTSGCSPCSDLVYLVDDSARLVSFDPRKLYTAQDPFVVIGTLACPASAVPLPGWPGPVVPYSLAVDRTGTARILYTSGELFSVDLSNAACTPTTFPPQQGNQWLLFQQAFSTDSAGGTAETEYVGGGSVNAGPGELFGSLDPDTLLISNLGNLPQDGTFAPELAGLADSTLFGFYAGTSSAFVQQIDKASGAALGTKLAISGGLGSSLSAWAFAHWGGRFYLFITTDDGVTVDSTVRTIDRVNGQVQVLLQNLPYRFTTANTATCAPLAPN